MVRIATPKPPKRLFRSRRTARAAMDAAIGPIPPGVEKLRQAARTIDPAGSYSLQTPDGQVVTTTGAELRSTVQLLLDIADAHEAGDEEAHRRACLALLASV